MFLLIISVSENLQENLFVTELLQALAGPEKVLFVPIIR